MRASRVRGSVLALALWIGPATVGEAATLRVPDEYGTIQGALDVAAASDTVLVGPGTYASYTQHGITWVIGVVPDGVVVISEAGVEATTLDLSAAPGEKVSGFFCDSHVTGTTSITGFTFTGHPSRAAGITAISCASVTVSDCAFVVEDPPPPNTLDYRLGINARASSLRVERCVFAGCTAHSGAAIHHFGASLTVVSSSFSNCQNRPISAHGGLGERPYALEVLDCSFSDVASAAGGGALASQDMVDGVLIQGSTFQHLFAESSGGALAIAGFGHKRVIGNVFFDADLPSGSGGFVSVVGGTSEIVGNTLVSASQVWGFGAAINVAATGSHTLANNIIAHTSGTTAVWYQDGASVDSHCNVFWDNEGGVGIPISGTSEVIDPQLCDTDGCDLRVAASSPCLPENNFSECAELIGALGVGCPSTGLIPVGLRSQPDGVLLVADGTTEAAPWLLAWPEGSSHQIGVPPSPVLPVPNSRYWFQSWQHGGPENQTVVAASEYMEYTALFDEEHFLTLEAEGEGAVGESHWIPAGESREILAIPDPGWQFRRWEGIGQGSYDGLANPVTVEMNNPIVQRAIFETQFLPLTMSVSGAGATDPETGPQPRRTLVPIEAIPAKGWAFSHWNGEGLGSYSGTNNPAQVAMEEPISQTAFFVDADPLLTMSVVGGGEVTPATGPQDVFTQVAIEATPAIGWEFGGWTGTGAGSYSGGNNPATVTMNEPITQTATFVVGELPLTMLAEEGGTVTPESGDVTSFTDVEIEAIPGPGYRFVQWKGEGDGSYTGTDNPASVTLNGPITQVAHFEPASFSATLSLSDTNPYVHTGGALGLGNVHLWVTCGSTERGLQSIALKTAGSLQPLAFLPAPGVSATGTGTVLAGIDGCPDGPVRLGSFLVNAPGEGSLCLEASGAVTGLTITDCEGATYSWPENVGFVGVHTGGGSPCGGGTGCEEIGPFAAPVGAPDVAAPPSATRLSGIFPNPFGSGTTIHFDVERPMDVRLAVFDVSGRQVKVLRHGRVPAGRHSVGWDGRDSAGQAVAGGVYFVRLTGDGVEQTEKVTVVRGRSQ